MWFPPKTQLQQASEATGFLTLRWRELFAKHVPDTYRPRLMDTPGLLDELQWVSELTIHDSRWARHLRLIIKELKQVVVADQLVKEHSPRLFHVIQELSSDAKPKECESIARLGLEELHAYEDWAFTELNGLLSQANSGKLAEKERAETLIGHIATRAVQRGF